MICVMCKEDVVDGDHMIVEHPLYDGKGTVEILQGEWLCLVCQDRLRAAYNDEDSERGFAVIKELADAIRDKECLSMT